MLSMRAPEHLDESPSSARSPECAFGDALPLRHSRDRARDSARPRLPVPRPAGHAARRRRRAGGDRLRRRRGPAGPLPPAELALQLAELKCAAVAARDDLPDGRAGARLRLGARARRRGARQARRRRGGHRRWRSMRGRSGVLLTGHCLRDTADRPRRVGDRLHDRALRRRRPTTRSRRTSRAASRCTSPARSPSTASAARSSPAIEGDHHNVVGLSLPLVRELMAELGHSWTDLWQPPPTR